MLISNDIGGGGGGGRSWKRGGFMCGGTLRGLAEVGGELGEPPTKMVSALPNTRP